MDRKTDGVLDFLAGYPVFVRDLAVSLRATIRSTIPEAREMLDLQGRVCSALGFWLSLNFVETADLTKTGDIDACASQSWR
jgi:hypothetical protein